MSGAKRKPQLTRAQALAARQMVGAALAGEEGEGDASGLTFALLRRTEDALCAIADAERSPDAEARDKLEAAASMLADQLAEAVVILRALRAGDPPPVALLDCIDSSVAALRAAGRHQ